MTITIQNAIDSCAAEGGGTVCFPAGTYISGGIALKSNITLEFEKGAVLQGSANYKDYKNDAFIFGKDLTDVNIKGEGIIDGVDCFNPRGEEGFRGPHCIRLINCKNIFLEGFTIINSANWAINCRYCSNAYVDKVSIRGGHDGLHTRFCNNFKVTTCDFRTGDDAFAGNDNRNFEISDCKINSSCNGFRIGCYNFTVKRCKIWGPGESIHKIQKRNNMLAAFVHFSPKDENPKLMSGNWLIQDVIVENADHFYMYNYNNGLWQTGQPVATVRFENVKVSGLLSAFNISGDSSRNFSLFVNNSSFSFREGAVYVDSSIYEGVKIKSPSYITISSFNQVELKDVVIEKISGKPVLNCDSGNSLVVKNVSIITGPNLNPFYIGNVRDVKKENIIYK